MKHAPMWIIAVVLVGGAVYQAAFSKPTAHQVAKWIGEVSGRKVEKDSRFSYVLEDLDGDGDREIIARERRTADAGRFLVLERSGRKYRLVAEKPWSVAKFKLREPTVIDGKRIYEVTEQIECAAHRQFIEHLWYMDSGCLVEAWSGIAVEDRMVGENVVRSSTNARGLDSAEGSMRYELYAEDTDAKTGQTIKERTLVEERRYKFDGTRFVLELPSDDKRPDGEGTSETSTH